MLTALKDIGESARALVRNRRALLLFFVTYLALLATLSLFVATREATVREVLFSLTALVAMPALFFLLQAMCVSYAETAGARELLRKAFRIFWRIAVASVPLILLGLALYFLLWKVETRINPQTHLPGGLARGAAKAGWPTLLFSTLRLLLFGLALPLAGIHLWLALVREDLRSVWGNLRGILSKAFAPRSVVTYVFGLVLFGVLPYFLIVSRTPFERAWLELTVLGARLLLAFCLMLFGWVATVGALHKVEVAESAQG
ncbi:MAG: hypothetical protein JO360_11465 [Acidobacteria bacterium]|nr:hypothetical protein [Acidobacteriota bacterium]